MTLHALLKLLFAAPDAAMDIELPDGSRVPAHFHITEVGRVRKDFIDCGGTVRSLERCVLQVWVAEDRDHRVSAGKLTRIIRAAAPILGDADLELEVEYDVGVISQFPVVAAEPTSGSGLLLRLGGKHTACLAADRCGVADAASGACVAPGCCAPSAAPAESARPLSIGVTK
jgi:hypothetical protein